MSDPAPLPASFRDPDGFVFLKDGILYRRVNVRCGERYDRLISSGLYDDLAARGLLVPHEETVLPGGNGEGVHRVLKPELIPFISYPYEWCFGQLKDAALATLEIQKEALRRGMSLKDCSAYNIQFRNGKAALIDTLSFELYREGMPWPAYRQFCQHFLAPLALMSLKDVRLSQLSRIHIDGIPLDLAAALLPVKAWARYSLATHIFLHAGSQKHFAGKPLSGKTLKMTAFAFRALIDSLESAVRGLEWKLPATEWGDYYRCTNYTADTMEEKKAIVSDFLDRAAPRSVWDLGANTGVFSRLAAAKGMRVVSFDNDPAAVETNYRACRASNETGILPLMLDLTNPSPAIGWENRERDSLAQRGPADAVLALAVIHHLAISNNLPLPSVARFLRSVCRSLIIEFVPKTDSQVQKLLASREDIFDRYTRKDFEEAFDRYFSTEAVRPVGESGRILYLLAARPPSA